MPIPSRTNDSTSACPFVVEHVLPAENAPGKFVPDARLLLTPALRRSGLLAQLPDAEARSLLLLLTFLSPNGLLRASVTELAEGLGTSPEKARRRMQRLTETLWQGEPLALGWATESGLELFAVSPLLVEERDAPLPSVPAPTYSAADREAVVAHSRARYAVPRAEAERQVAAQYGLPVEEAGDSEEAVARRELYALGVPRDQIDELLRGYPLERIRQQLDWLPLRNAKSPARFVIAAVQRNYDPPLQAQTHSALEGENTAVQRTPDALPTDTLALDIPQSAEGPETAEEGGRA